MNKKAFIVVLLVLVLFTLNFSVAHEINNSTIEDSSSATGNGDVLTRSDVNQTPLTASPQIKTQIDVRGNTTFDVVGSYFNVRLSDGNGNALKNTNVIFTIAGNNYVKTTNNYGIASLQLNLNDGSYKITTKFLGNSKYKASSRTTTIIMKNTIVVAAGLSNAQIQKIIDNAKDRNVILFSGPSYSNINLVINKRLTLMSKSNTVLKSSSNSPVFTIRGKHASLTTIKGFNIQGDGNGIAVSNSDYVTIINNNIATKGNGIVANGVKYLNTTKNNIVQNSRNGVVVVNSELVYIISNKISDNGGNGIELVNSSKVYIYGNTISNNGGNGIYVSNQLGGVVYGQPENLYINKNTITKNNENGIDIFKAGNNININGNTIVSNTLSGVLLNIIGNNKIQSNEIASNGYVGIRFNDDYIKPGSQDISYNALFRNGHVQVEAKDTYYYDNGEQLEIGDNWYSDKALICPRVNTNRIQFVVRQIGENQFQASFVDSNGNIASLLPDRTLTYTTNDGQSVSITVKGGSGVFTVDANNGDIVKATVDYSSRENVYDGSTPSSNPYNGVTPSYSYPDIPYDSDEYEMGNGNGGGNGNGNGGSGNSGEGFSQSGDTGNSTYNSQQNNPGNNANNPAKDVSSNYNSEAATSSQGASSSGDASNAASQSQAVAKRIVFEEDEFFRVTGMSFILLLIILTIAYYYRDDIKEMNSKR